MTALGVDPAKDAADDMRRLLTTAGVVLGAFSVGAATQSVFVYGVPLVVGSTLDGLPGLILRTLANLLACAAALGLCAWLPRRSLIGQISIGLVIAVGAALLRHGLQIALGIYSDPSTQTSVVEVLSAGTVTILAIALGVAQMRSQARLRAQDRAVAEQRLRATTALAALSEEELRVRRSVAENLHGGLQGRLVMVHVQLGRILDRWHAGVLDDDDRRALEQVRNQLDTLREHEVRQVSHLLYPAGVDTGLAYALKRLVRRVPSQIEIEAHIGDTFDEEMDAGNDTSDATVLWRIALLSAAEEAISNALRHGAADRIGIQLLARGEGRDHVVLIVDDNGLGISNAAGPQHGLALSEERLKRLGGSQHLEASPWGGVRLIAELPVHSRHNVRSM